MYSYPQGQTQTKSPYRLQQTTSSPQTVGSTSHSLMSSQLSTPSPSKPALQTHSASSICPRELVVTSHSARSWQSHGSFSHSPRMFLVYPFLQTQRPLSQTSSLLQTGSQYGKHSPVR